GEGVARSCCRDARRARLPVLTFIMRAASARPLPPSVMTVKTGSRAWRGARQRIPRQLTRRSEEQTRVTVAQLAVQVLDLPLQIRHCGAQLDHAPLPVAQHLLQLLYGRVEALARNGCACRGRRRRRRLVLPLRR